MYIQSIEGKNFRGLPDFSLDLHKRLNVFIGNNGVGKSSILHFIAIMISQCGNITTDKLDAKISDINNDQTELSGKIKCKYNNSYILSEYLYSENSTQKNSFENFSGDFNDKNENNRPFSQFRAELEGEIIPFEKNFPLVVSYPTNRALLEIPERIRGFKPAVHPFDALENALESYLDFRSFIALLRMSENAFKQRSNSDQLTLFDSFHLDHYAQWQATQVKAVNDAISAVVPEFGELHVTQKPFRISVQKNRKTFDFLQLSDGEKCLIALLGDLAQRLAICNPALENPLEGDAIVLIDELELHLHPVWQSSLIHNLLETFPNCQFIITTHSPLVLSGVQAESIWVMEEEDAPYHPERSYGMESSELLREVMGAESRTAAVTAALDRIDRLLDSEQFDAARTAIQELAERTGNIPAIHAANSYLTMMGEKQAEIGE